MNADQPILQFLSYYSDVVSEEAFRVRKIILESLPSIQEQIDHSAKMIAYSYGPKYSDMICTIIPSKKGVKLGFYKGNELPDPDGILEGTGKISRYVQFAGKKEIKTSSIKNLLLLAQRKYEERSNKWNENEQQTTN